MWWLAHAAKIAWDLHGGFSPQDYIQLPVTRVLLNPNVPPLFSLAVNSFEFLPCDSTPQVECFAFRVSNFWRIGKHSSLTVWATEVSNLICSPHFRSSVSIHDQGIAFAFDVPTRMLLFYQSSGHSIPHIMIPEIRKRFLFARLINHTIPKRTFHTTYLLFRPSPYAQHFPSLSYRGGWHRVCQGFYFSTQKMKRKINKVFDNLPSLNKTKAFLLYLLQKCLIRRLPIVKYSSLLPRKMRMGLVSVPLWPFSRKGRLWILGLECCNHPNYLIQTKILCLFFF